MKDLNLLYTFEALWRDHSASVAAENLGVTQAGVSAALKRLRQDFGDKLFTVVGRRMEPTPFAIEIAPLLLQSLELARAAKIHTVNFDPSTCRKKFKLRMRDIGEVVCLPSILEHVLSSAPESKIETEAGSLEDTLQGLSTGRIDLAIGFLPQLQTDIHYSNVFKQKYVCVFRKGHPLEKQELTFETFLAQKLLCVDAVGSGHFALEKALVDYCGKESVQLRIAQSLAAPHLLLTTNLIWVAPEALAKTFEKNLPICIRPLPLDIPPFEIAMYWHDRYHRDPENKWLRETVGRALKESVIGLTYMP
ncbi:LysR family transcriptional regulator [Pseudomonas sp. P39-UII1]|uniref:LysR family transcriptional regulator n=1 Tax=Pseudomonas sp. P39-UII1 TaxID=3080333 RepID=UPI00320A147D